MTSGTNEGDMGTTRPMEPVETPGMVIGRYHLLQKIGEGGMGEVWLAEQKEPIRRRVALKLVKAGLNSREVIARFESERQALALMDHPAIARVFDAGSSPQGAPYFVMEYVAGVPITTYCDNHRLSTRERLELFMHVCEGVQHAHQKAIIHRDLKPSNILVTEVDGRAAPKIIDFGVAKALTLRLTADTMFTRAGALVGTPEYMSPEQANSSGQDIDTRTDVYSLGIILYELLAGAPPLDLRKIAFEEFLRRLREDDPPKPSTKIRTQDPVTSTDLARKRHTEPLALLKQLRGDLDSIALKALEKDRARRYGSPSDFGADIGRYLRNEAVLAVAPSAAYRARKFARRYRGALATAAAFMVVLMVAAGISIGQSIRATRQRNRADAEAAVAQAVNDFLQNDLLAQASAAAQSGPAAKPDPDLKVRTALDRAASRIGGKFNRQPEVEAAIRETIGETYMDLGLYPEARRQLERALDLQRRVLGEDSPKTLHTLNRVGRVTSLQGKYPAAEAVFRRTLESQRRVLGPQNPDTLDSMYRLAGAYNSEGEYKQAEKLYKETLESERHVLGPEHPATLMCMHDLGVVYEEQSNYRQAGDIYAQILETQRRLLGPEHPDTLKTLNNLANTYAEQDKFMQAEELHGKALEIRRRVLGPEHPDTMQSLYNLGLDYFGQRDYAKARAAFSEALEIQRRVLGAEHPKTLLSMNTLAESYYALGMSTEAEALFRQVLEIRRRVLGPEHPATLYTCTDLSLVYESQRKYALAGAFAAQSLAGRRRFFGSENPDTMMAAADLALADVSQGKFAEGEALAREALQYAQKKEPDDWQRFRFESLVGASLAGQKKYAEAEPLLIEGYTGMVARKDQIDSPDWYHHGRAREWIVELYQAWGKPEKAAEWRKK